jgi:membrane protease YdiL (CAAX protease family)
MVLKTMHLVDHIFILLLFGVLPFYGAWSYQQYLKRIAAGAPPNRVRLYQETLVMQWVAFAVVAGAWVALGRPAAELGFTESSITQIGIGALVVALVTAYLFYAWRVASKMSDEEKSTAAAGLGTMVHFLPQDNRDYRHFVGVSITAGIVEEFLYRGFAFWYLAHFMPMWAVVLVSSIAFGLGHTYQGTGGVVRVALVGIVFGIFYILTGSIWLPMLAHVVLDILQGATVLAILNNREKMGTPA